MTMREKEETS